MNDWQKLEAVLFGSGKYLTEEQLSELSGVPKNNLKKALSDLKKHYSDMETSLQVFNEDNSWKLNVKEEFKDVMQRVISEVEMPRPIMETLAYVAYKTPVLQSEIINSRGSGAYEHIGILEEKGFIVKEKFGRSFKLKLTEKFHEYFDIEGDSKLAELFKDVKPPEKIGALEVYDMKTSDEEFTEKVLERMKKIEQNPKDDKEKDEFLEKMDSKLNDAKSRIDETERELEEFRPPKEESENENGEFDINKINAQIDELTEESKITKDDVEEIKKVIQPKKDPEEFAEKQYLEDD